MGGLRSAGGGGVASVRPLLPAQGPARPWRKVGPPAPARSATQVIVGSFVGVFSLPWESFLWAVVVLGRGL